MGPATPLVQVLLGDTSPEVLDALRRQVGRWLAQELAPGRKPLPLHRYLGLPASPTGLRRQLRDDLLIEAAGLIAGGAWERSTALAEAARAFEVRRWPHWRALPAPPSEASPVDTRLWHCLRLGAELPDSARQYLNIIAK